ncbi:hypothetical protein EDF38_0624 [Frigoribacterium sp. PhB160]|uniref:hypothetical protein n=1 Tax=Frigoribacterium sp. PhB160 TaxID=2485192 RepID=UPI000F934C8E|nr:hypothetical protein [Frigoribacterium sp. PhB160]ROS61534.1 hypothetical protein EDF38_0624 [Frigoribacterium sp. PhB160]
MSRGGGHVGDGATALVVLGATLADPVVRLPAVANSGPAVGYRPGRAADVRRRVDDS